jgi:putative nucleotidyltransferase with HDIG domain
MWFASSNRPPRPKETAVADHLADACRTSVDGGRGSAHQPAAARHLLRDLPSGGPSVTAPAVDYSPRMSLVAWAYETSERTLSSALPRRWAHVQGVARKARSLAAALSDDAALLEAAAILHDVGYAPDLAQTGFHPLDGARFLRTIDAPERLVSLVAHRSCAEGEARMRGLEQDLAVFKDEASPTRDDPVELLRQSFPGTTVVALVSRPEGPDGGAARDRLMTTQELARMLGVDPSSVRRWRTAKPVQGPPFIRMSGRVVKYRREDVERWLDGRRFDPEVA